MYELNWLGDSNKPFTGPALWNVTRLINIDREFYVIYSKVDADVEQDQAAPGPG